MEGQKRVLKSCDEMRREEERRIIYYFNFITTYTHTGENGLCEGPRMGTTGRGREPPMEVLCQQEETRATFSGEGKYHR